MNARWFMVVVCIVLMWQIARHSSAETPRILQGVGFDQRLDDQIRRLTDAVGVRYRFDAAQKQFVHASGIMIVTPQGKLSRYFYDVRYAGRDLRLGLIEASQNKIGSPIDQILLYCFHYDPTL